MIDRDYRSLGYLPVEGPLSSMPVPSWEGGVGSDPITHEVLRNRIYSVNEELGLTIVNVSGSPVATFAHDFAACVLTPEGEVVYFGPYNQHQVGQIDLNVKWILMHRGVNPGIRDGDMFLG